MPAIINRKPANCKGDWYCNPILTTAKAVDQSQVAKIARKVVVLIMSRINTESGAKVRNKPDIFSQLLLENFGRKFMLIDPSIN